jgi:ribosome biogenesis GTPase / thiamine phosphate phosphatase
VSSPSLCPEFPDQPYHHAPVPGAPRPRPVPDDLRQGVVVRVDRGAATVESGGELVRAGWGGILLASVAGDPEGWPCTGDRVGWRRWPDGRSTVETVLPRRTLLRRSDASRGSRLQPLAANVDLVAVVEALLPDPDPVRVQRMLALAWASGAEPLLVLTKADLVPDPERLAADLLADALAELPPAGRPAPVPDAAAGCLALLVSARTGAGLDLLATRLAGRTTALLGASGVGKSSLLNALAERDRNGTAPLMRVRALRTDGRGRHTTVTRELHHVAGGAVIDGPGLRSVSLGDGEGLDRTFRDLVDLAAGCRFADCAHREESGCELVAAVERGDLAGPRLDSWLALKAEGRREQERRERRVRADQARSARAARARAARGRAQDSGW